MTWDVDPFAFERVRWYSLCFVAALMGGAVLFGWRLQKAGRRFAEGWDFLVLGSVSILVGTRVAQLLFYEPRQWLADPLRFFRFWEGGLASHGAVLGLVPALVWFGRRRGIAPLDICDQFAWSAAAAVVWVRLGNLFNSEILGRPTQLPWGVRFVRVDGPAGPFRHPSQVYELLLGLGLLAVLTLLDRRLKPDARKPGLFAGVFLLGFFGVRCGLELVKAGPATGLWLSVPFAGVGAWLVVLLPRRRSAGA